MKRVLIILFSLMTVALSAQEKGAAKAIIVKGKVKAIINGKEQPVKKGMWLPEGAEVKTEKRSFAKLLFIDKSSMNVGPESKMKIDSFPKKDAGIITLIKGQIRSKVTKNYMEMKKKNKSKLFIKTETAAMGVRGTDFIVSFNPVNKATSLITLEGAVAMAKLTKNIQKQSGLEKVVSSPSAVIVKRGQYSGAAQGAEKVSPPVKVSPAQIETLEKNDVPGLKSDKVKGKEGGAPKKTFKSVIPPGVDPVSMANDASEATQSMASAVGTEMVTQVNTEVKVEVAKADNYGPKTDAGGPDGAANGGAEANKPRAGGIIDLKSASYFAPPEDAVYDANSETYVMPSDVGFVNADGDFENKYYDVNLDGSVTEKKIEVADQQDGRFPASNQGAAGPNNEGDQQQAPPPPPPPVAMDIEHMADGLPETAGADNATNAVNLPNIINIPPEAPDAPLPPGPPPQQGSHTRAKFNINHP